MLCFDPQGELQMLILIHIRKLLLEGEAFQGGGRYSACVDEYTLLMFKTILLNFSFYHNSTWFP